MTKFAALKNTTYIVGLVLAALSFLLFSFSMGVNSEEAFFGIFFVNYIMTIGYWFVVIIQFAFHRKSYHFYYIFPALVLSLISAYSLNRVINIFDISTTWYSVVLVVSCLAVLALAVLEDLPRWGKFLLTFLIGIAFIVFFYTACYLINYYFFSLVLGIALGISLHTFIPLLFFVVLIVWFIHTCKKHKKIWIGSVSGIGFSLIVVAVYCVMWSNTVSQINKSYQQAIVQDEAALPNWVTVAQHIPKDMITNQVLKSGFVYVLPSESRGFFSFSAPSRFTEQKKHSPLVVIASIFGGRSCLSEEEAIRILESIYDCRHQATERFWSDEDIETTHISTFIKLWPQYRTAYTEKYIMLRNNSQYEWGTGEALYTFHLPEGSVATSLSLWINGVEEKGILTTKEKADSAYRTIVGVENRDPSVIHWQEGSTLSVRVFPVTQKEGRSFKIGITSPLQNDGNHLVYQPIYFEGTNFSKAEETVELKFIQKDLDESKISLPFFLKTTGVNAYTGEKQYSPNWEITMPITPISSGTFCFDGSCYMLDTIANTKETTQINDVYFDLNSLWTKSEFQRLFHEVSAKKAWAYDGSEMIELSKENIDRVFDNLHKLEFSLFPIHKIEHPDHSLLISKSSISPNFSDLKNSPFFRSLTAHYETEKNAVLFFNIGEDLSPFWKTLREYRLLQYRQGFVGELKTILSSNNYPLAESENDSTIVIHSANISIRKQEMSRGDNTKEDAPDHLMRLFAYNHIMQNYAQCWIVDSGNFLREQMVKEAQQAYVVSPVSSLIVLETQNDYDRFDIHNTENSLQNASKTSKGAVPEPHEWVLIILAGGIAIYLFVRHRKILLR